jgi:hypothetical protein
MATQRLLIGTVVGGIVLFFVGYLLFGIVFADFFAANAGTASGVPKMPFNFVALGIGQLGFAAALTLILGWAGVRDIATGATTAGIVGLLFFLGIDLTMYATTNTQNLTATLVDPVISAVLFAVAGAAIAAVAGKKG